jgi:hypothetical protein
MVSDLGGSGVRNEFQGHLGVRERAAQNLEYSKSGLNHVAVGTLSALGKRYFHEVELIPRLWELSDRGNGSFKAAMLVTPRLHRYATWLYSRALTVVMFLRK